jgi:hypothetical protein
LKSSGDLCGLLEIFIGRAPEEETSGEAADRDSNTDLCGHPEDAILHRGGTRAFRDRQVGGGVAQRFDLLLERVVALSGRSAFTLCLR